MLFRPLRLWVPSVAAQSAFSPATLFAAGEQGAWYDPSDFSTLFQDAVGSTPVTAVEQPVRLMRDISGRTNHATAPNDASRPVLRARYNLLTFTEQFDNAGWDKRSLASITSTSQIDPLGGSTAETVTYSGTDADAVLFQSVLVTANTNYQFSIYVKAGTAPNFTLAARNVAWTTNIAFQLFSATSEWVRCELSFNSGTNTTITVGVRGSTTFAGTILLWGAQLLTAADQAATGGAYQRVAAATSYDTSNPVFRPYLAFDGTDDSFSTSSIDFTATDKMTVFAGLSKFSPVGTVNVLAELSADRNSNNGAWTAVAAGIASEQYGFYSKGSISASASTFNAIYAAPITNVLTGIGNIGGDVVTLRLNGTQAATNTDDQGTGNYANAALFIGRRNNASLPFNGRLYSLLVLGRAATTPELTSTETWINGKTGAY